MNLPLSGKTIVITRAATQSTELADLLKEKGARIIELPTIDIVLQPEKIPALRRALSDIGSYSWLILTSVNTVAIVNDVLNEGALNWRLFDSLRIACIGKATAAAVEKCGGKVALVPPRFQSESLAEELIRSEVYGKKILLPRAAGSRQVLPQLLEEAGATVNEIHLYRSELPEKSRAVARQVLEQPADFITFTSSSTVHHFAEMAKELQLDVSKLRIACIGPITAATLKEYGIQPDVEAAEFTMSGLVDAMVASL